MTQQTSSTPDYTMGFSEEFLTSLRRYTAEASAAYLMPYLRPGHRLLDFGCGPGTISVGLAKAIAPGEFHGIDMESSQIDLAKAVVQARRQGNATFHVGDITDMPFEDGYFDVAHCHNVLMHIPDTAAALAEVRRVLKPGGIIACREMITASCFTHPDFGVIRKAWDMFEDLLEADDAHPQIGKDLKTRILGAGFENVDVTATFDIYDTPAGRRVHLRHRQFMVPGARNHRCGHKVRSVAPGVVRPDTGRIRQMEGPSGRHLRGRFRRGGGQQAPVLRDSAGSLDRLTGRIRSAGSVSFV